MIEKRDGLEPVERPDGEMPRYKCHKEVHALKIKAVEPRPFATMSGAIITPEDDGFGPFEVSEDYFLKHEPRPGGYYVRYADGYESFSPADAFESGYTRI